MQTSHSCLHSELLTGLQHTRSLHLSLVTIVVLAMQTATTLAQSERTVPLFSWWNPHRGDNFATSDPRWGMPVSGIRWGRSGQHIANGPSVSGHGGGYKLYRLEGFLFDPKQRQPPGTVPLFSWWNPHRGDNFATSDPRWGMPVSKIRWGRSGQHIANGPSVSGHGGDYKLYRLEGFLFDPKQRQPPGTVPLFSWWNPHRGDNFATSDPRWGMPVSGVRWHGEHITNGPSNNVGGGYKLYRLEGYLFDPKRAAPPPPPTTIRLTISRHSSVSFTERDADRILSDATKALQNKDGDDDVACNVKLVRSGNVGEFDQNQGKAQVDSAEDLDQVQNLPRNIKVVDELRNCGGIRDINTIGCALTPGSSIVIQIKHDGESWNEGALWAHEVGHNRGSIHRDTSDRNIMNSIISNSDDQNQINRAECTAFLSGSGAAASAIAGKYRSAGRMVTIREFVLRTYAHGLPLDKALEYSEKDATELVELLSQSKYAEYHGNIALALGIIGRKSAIEPLKSYITKHQHKRSWLYYRGRGSALVAIGYLAATTKDRSIIEFLSGISERYFDLSKIMNRKRKVDRNFILRNADRFAVKGLGVSGSPLAAEHLNRVRQMLEEAGIRPSDGGDHSRLVLEAITTNKKIMNMKGGLKSYILQISRLSVVLSNRGFHCLSLPCRELCCLRSRVWLLRHGGRLRSISLCPERSRMMRCHTTHRMIVPRPGRGPISGDWSCLVICLLFVDPPHFSI